MAYVVLDHNGTGVHISTPKGNRSVPSAAVVFFWIALFVLVCWIGAVDGRRHKRPQSCAKSENDRTTSTSFLWRIANEPPSYFFGTIHVPYSRVWDYVPVNVKRAFDASDAVFFELDLTDPNTISALTSCQLLPAGQRLIDVLPLDLYIRLKRHLDYVKAEMPRWISSDQRVRGLYADYLFNAITGNWERKRPIWVMLMVNSLTESDVKSRGIPVLDLYLAQEAERRNKRMGAVERVEEQCLPLNGLNFSQVVFALNQTLHHQELLRAGDESTPYTTDDLIKHYNCGDLDAVIFSHDTAQVPIMTNVTPAPYEQLMAKKIDDYFRQELILKRNLRMGQRVLELLTAHPDKSFFFAFGAGHFLGNYTVLDVVQAGGYIVEQLPNSHKLPKHRKKPTTSNNNNKTPRLATPLVPEPSTLRDFSTRLRSNKLDNDEGSFPHYVSEMHTVRPTVSNQMNKMTFRPPTLLKTSPNLLTSVKEADPYSSNSGRYRNFNDLWVRLANVGQSHLSLHPIASTATQDRNSPQMEDSLIWIRYGPRSFNKAPDLCPWSQSMILLLSLFVSWRGIVQFSTIQGKIIVLPAI